tara:strand:- start:10825 stop:11289 length:465 start_codon:yes stop_codon:yes gene_type:complete
MRIRNPVTAAIAFSLWALFFTSGAISAEPDRGAIKSVVEQQLAAFRQDNAALAFSFASPKIQKTFGSPERFLSMVKSGYPPVYRPQSVTFLDVVMLRGQPTQRVLLTGPDGTQTTAHYFMEQQPDGRWLIDGCVLSAPEALSVEWQGHHRPTTG